MATAPATMIANTKAALTTIDERLTSSCTCGKPVTSGEVKNAAVRNETSPPSMPWTRSASHSIRPLSSQSVMAVYPPRMPWRTSRITGARTARAYPASAALKLPLACSAWAGSPPAVMYRRPPTTRNRVATAARIPMIHTLRPSMTSGMVFAARTSGAGAAAIRSPAAETMVYVYMSGLHEGRWAAFGGEPRDVLAGGGAPPYVVCEGWWSVRPYRVPASRPGSTPHRGGHAISGMHPPRPALSGQTNPPPTCPKLTPPNDAGHTARGVANARAATRRVTGARSRIAHRSDAVGLDALRRDDNRARFCRPIVEAGDEHLRAAGVARCGASHQHRAAVRGDAFDRRPQAVGSAHPCRERRELATLRCAVRAHRPSSPPCRLRRWRRSGRLSRRRPGSPFVASTLGDRRVGQDKRGRPAATVKVMRGDCLNHAQRVRCLRCGGPGVVDRRRCVKRCLPACPVPRPCSASARASPSGSASASRGVVGLGFHLRRRSEEH